MDKITDDKKRLILARAYLEKAESDLEGFLKYRTAVIKRIKWALINLRSAKTFMGDKKRLVEKHRFLKATSRITSFCDKCGSVCLSCDNCKDAILPDEKYFCFGRSSLGKGIHGCKKCYESSVGGDKNG